MKQLSGECWKLHHRFLEMLTHDQLNRRWMAKYLLAILTAFLCIILSPVFAKSPAVNTNVPSLTEKSIQTQDLEQQDEEC